VLVPVNEPVGEPASSTHQQAVRPRAIRLRRRPTALAGAAAAGVSALLLVSACTGHPGEAASFDGHTVSVKKVQDATHSLQLASPTQFGQLTPSAVLSVLIIAPYAEHAASAAGKGVSDSSVRAALLAQGAQAGFTQASVAKLDAGALEALRGSLAMSALDETAQQDVIKQVQGAHVEVAPRYGTWDVKTAQIVATTPNWLQPTATASASATASDSASPTSAAP
jgi:hypothetical protein